MSLADYQPERTEIEYKGRPLASVRGLNLNDLSILVRAHGAALRRIYDESRPPDGSTLIDLAKVAITTITQEPSVAFHAIALASDEPNNTEAASRLSAPLQLKMLMAVLRLTFEDVGGPLAFAALVKDLFVGVAGMTPPAEAATIQ